MLSGSAMMMSMVIVWKGLLGDMIRCRVLDTSWDFLDTWSRMIGSMALILADTLSRVQSSCVRFNM